MKVVHLCLFLLCAGACSAAVADSSTQSTEAPGAKKKWSPANDRFALTIKSGRFKLGDDTQTIAGSQRRFDDSVGTIAIEGEAPVYYDSVVLGGEIMRYSPRFGLIDASGGSSLEDKLQTLTFLVKAKYFFGTQVWRPYLGAGAGIMWVTDFTGPVEGLGTGFALQAVAGMELRWRVIGVRAEYSYLGSRLDDDKGDKIDVSGNVLFMGVSIHW